MGAETISDIVVLAIIWRCSGSVASTRRAGAYSTPLTSGDSLLWRLLGRGPVRWPGPSASKPPFARSRVAGTAGRDALVIDLDAHVLVCHSEKEQPRPAPVRVRGLGRSDHPLEPARLAALRRVPILWTLERWSIADVRTDADRPELAADPDRRRAYRLGLAEHAMNTCLAELARLARLSAL